MSIPLALELELPESGAKAVRMPPAECAHLATLNTTALDVEFAQC